MASRRNEISLGVLKKYFRSERSTTKDALFILFQKLRFELDYISLQSVVYLYL